MEPDNGYSQEARLCLAGSRHSAESLARVPAASTSLSDQQLFSSLLPASSFLSAVFPKATYAALAASPCLLGSVVFGCIAGALGGGLIA